MKMNMKVCLAAIAMAFCGMANAQYQVANGDFETWTYDGENLPNNWNSFQTADGTFASSGYSSSNRQVKRSEETRPGTDGNYSCSIWARSIFGVIAQGNLTTGRVHAGSMSAANKDNYNYSDRDGKNTNNNVENPVENPCAMKFSGHPDKISVWVKFVPAGNVKDYPNARFYAVIHDDNDYITYGLSSNDTEKNKGYVVASALKEFPACDWTNYVMDFDYTENSDSKYIIINASTNSYPGKGTAGDKLYLDDIVLIYNSQLAGGATYNGTDLRWSAGKATVDEVYDASKLVLESNGKGATIERSYDEATAKLTVTVKGEDISVNSGNYHNYYIQFASPTPTVGNLAKTINAGTSTKAEIDNMADKVIGK